MLRMTHIELSSARRCLEEAFREFVQRAVAAGWKESEVALTLADIADDYVMARSKSSGKLVLSSIRVRWGASAKWLHNKLQQPAAGEPLPN